MYIKQANNTSIPPSIKSSQASSRLVRAAQDMPSFAFVCSVFARRPSLVDALPEYECSHLFLVSDPAVLFLKPMPHILSEIDTWHSQL
jgi:hypothetical protein